MKRYIILLLVVITGLSACKKKTDDFDQNAQAAKDDAALNAYFTANHISPVKDPSGLYYTIDIPGNGDYPNSASTVTVDTQENCLTALNLTLMTITQPH